MPLVTSRDYQLTPDVLGAVGSGVKTTGQIQELQGQSQARDLSDQARQLQGVIMNESLPQEQRAQAKQQLAGISPQAAQQLQTLQRGQTKQLNEREQSILSSVTQSAAQAKTLPSDEARLNFFKRRKAELENNNIPTDDTQEFIDRYEAGDVEGANDFLDRTIQLGEQYGFIKPAGAGFGSVQSSKQLPGGLVQVVFRDGTTKTVEPSEADKLLIQSAEERGASLQGKRAGERDAAKQAIKISGQAFENVGKIERNITNLEEVVGLVADGAETGPLSAKLPSFRAATVELDNMRNRLGLDVIGAVTFGALSKGELDLALDTALPTKLDGPELVDWANKKIDAQRKLSNYFREQALFLGKGNKLSDFLEQKRTEAPAQQSAQALPQGVTEEDIAETMRANNMTREQVMQRLQSGG